MNGGPVVPAGPIPHRGDVVRQRETESEHVEKPDRRHVPVHEDSDPADHLAPRESLQPPPLPSRLLPRPGVERRLDDLDPVSVIEALPGTGRTSLAAIWARQLEDEGAIVLWLSQRQLQESERLFSTVATTLSSQVNGQRVSGDLDPHRSTDHTVATVKRSRVLIIDDVEDRSSADNIDRLIGVAGRQRGLHLVLVCREAKEIRSSAQRHGVRMDVITGADLAVPPSSLPELASSWEHDLSPERAAELFSVVGGWCTPLRIILDTTPAGETSFVTHGARDYLEQVAKELQAADARELEVAMRFAVSEDLTCELASALVEVEPRCELQDGGALAIAALERRGLLQRTADRAGAVRWRYPYLVRSVLVDLLEREHPSVAEGCHRAVAASLRRRGGPGELGATMVHARRGADWPLLTRMWVETSWQLAVAAPAEFQAAYGALSDSVLQEHPALRFPQTLADGLAGTANDESVARTVQRHYLLVGKSLAEQAREFPDETTRLTSFVAGLAACRSEGRLAAAQRIATEVDRSLAAARAREDHAVVAAQTAWFSLHWGATHLLEGDHSSAMETLTAAYELSPRGPVAPQAATLMALLHASNGERTEATRHLDFVATHEWGHAGLRDLLTAVPALVAEATLAMDRLDEAAAGAAADRLRARYHGDEFWFAAARALTRHAILFGNPMGMLSELEQAAARHEQRIEQNPHSRRAVDRLRAELLLALGEVNRVQNIVGDGHTTPPWLRTVAARLYLIAGDHTRADQIASAGVWSTDTRPRDTTEQLMIKAAAELARGAVDDAVRSFQHGHVLAERSGNHAAYLALPPDARRELESHGDIELPAEVRDRLETMRSPYPSSAQLIELTPREREVLLRLRQVDSAATIARELSVSRNTVKKQMASLYAKLDVHDRSSALARAEQLGLVRESSHRT